MNSLTIGRTGYHMWHSLNSSVNDSTGKSPHCILYRVEKYLPYDLLTSPQQPVYNTDNYTQQQLHVLGKIHASVRSKLKATKTEMMANQHKRAIPVNFKPGDNVMTQQPERMSKLSPKFLRPYRTVRYVYESKFEVMEPNTNVTLVIHSDRLKKMPSCSNSPLAADSVPKDHATADTRSSVPYVLPVFSNIRCFLRAVARNHHTCMLPL